MIICAALAAAAPLVVAEPAAGQTGAGVAKLELRSPVSVQVERWRPWITEASGRFGVPSQWIAAVIRAESGGETRIDGRAIVSRAGAMGLMQLMPETWRTMRRQFGLGTDPHHPRDNILAGTAYLRAMYDRFGYPGLFGAYNAGPERYADYLARRRSLPAETRAYVATIVDGSGPVGAPPTRAGAGLFVGSADLARTPAAALFVSGAQHSLFYALPSAR